MLESIYTTSSGQAEQERLRNFHYPTKLSKDYIHNPKGLSILDVGAGSNSMLGSWIREGGGFYTALDVRGERVRAQYEEGNPAVLGSAHLLPFAQSAYDVVHTRFVHAHMSKEDRLLAISEALRVADQRAIFLEFDWRSFGGDERIDKFVGEARELFDYVGYDPDYGGKWMHHNQLTTLINHGFFEVDMDIIRRSRGNYGSEVIPLADSFIELTGAIGMDDLQMRLMESRDTLIEGNEAGDLLFTPPMVIGVDVVKKRNGIS